MSLELMYITNNPQIAIIAEKSGVNRIWIDLETLGKEERQKGLNTVKSHHTIADIGIISKILTSAKLQVRIDPWNENSKIQIEDVINAGAELIMLPMWKTTEEVKKFVDSVAGRTKTILLLETKEAEECLDEVLKIKGIDEIHIGLNDLHLSYHLKFMFELLSNGTVEKICNKIKKTGIPYGFGGISHLGDGMLPADYVIMEHYRLGSTRAILSRGFCDVSSGNMDEIEKSFIFEMKKLREYEDSLKNRTEEDYLKNKKRVSELVNKIVEAK